MKVLVFRIGALGDTVVALPALYSIRNHFGNSSHITLLRDFANNKEVVPDSLLKGHSTIDEFICYPRGLKGVDKYLALWAFIRKVRKSKFDVLVYLGHSQRRRRGQYRHWVIFRVCGIHQLLGFKVFGKDTVCPVDHNGRPRKVKQEAFFILDRLKEAGIQVPSEKEVSHPNLELSEEEIQSAEKWLYEHRRHVGRPLIGVAPACDQPFHQWPIDRFVEAGRILLSDKLCEFLIVGGSKEYDLGRYLISKWGSGINAARGFSPRFSASLLWHSQLFWGLNSGPMHLAAAVGIRCVAIFSDRENPGHWYPLGKGHRIIRKSVPCGGAGCSLQICNKNGHACMTGISAEEVANVICEELALSQRIEAGPRKPICSDTNSSM